MYRRYWHRSTACFSRRHPSMKSFLWHSWCQAKRVFESYPPSLRVVAGTISQYRASQQGRVPATRCRRGLSPRASRLNPLWYCLARYAASPLQGWTLPMEILLCICPKRKLLPFREVWTFGRIRCLMTLDCYKMGYTFYGHTYPIQVRLLP